MPIAYYQLSTKRIINGTAKCLVFRDQILIINRDVINVEKGTE